MRRLLIPAACCLVLAAGACGGEGQDADTDQAGKQPAGSTTSTDPEDGTKRAATTTDCTAEASTTGAYEAAWGGDGQVRTGDKAADEPGPRAVYTLTDQKNRLTMYSPGIDFKGNVSLSIGKTVYSSDPADAASLDIDERGTTAHVDVTLTSIEGHTVDLVADFTCGKPERQ